MKIRLKRTIGIYILMMTFLIGLVEMDFFWKIFLLMFFALIIFNSHNRKTFIRFKDFWIATGILLSMILLTTLLNGNLSYLAKNIWTIVVPIVILIQLRYIDSDQDNVLNFCKRKYVLLNCICLFSMFALTLQENGVNFLIKSTWLAKSSYREDIISGIFGLGGSHIFSIYVVTVLILNFDKIKKSEIHRRMLFILYNVFLFIWFSMLSTGNDNNTFFVLFTAYLLFVLYLSGTLKLRVKNIVIILSIILIGYFVINSPQINTFLNKTFLPRFKSLSNNTTGGSNERIYIPMYAINHGFGLGIGKGFSSEALDGTSNPALFPHFGINSFGTLVYLCGILGYAIFTYYIYFLTVKKHFNKKCKIVILLSIVMLSIYSPVYWDFTALVFVYVLNNLLNDITKV